MKITFFIFLIFSSSLHAMAIEKDSFILDGRIVDSSNEPLIGVAVLVKGSNFSTITDIEGYFKLKITESFLQSDSITVIFNYAYGYQTKEKVYKKSKLMQINFEEIILEREPMEEIIVRSSFKINSKIQSVELTPEQIEQIQKSPFKGCGSPGVKFEQIKNNKN